MKTTTSIWEGTAEGNITFPAFGGNVKADVVIIGGGITGVTAAMLLGNAGKKVILLEAQQIGLGTTGNSTGNLYVTVDEHLSVIRKKWSADTMKALVQSRQAAINFIEQNVSRYSIDCNFLRTSFNYFAENLDDEIENFLKEEQEALLECGLHPQLTENIGMPFGVKKMLTVSGQAQFHPLKYVRKLAAAIKDKCFIYENSAVIDFDEKEGTVKTANGTVTADFIIMATHVPKGVFPVQTVLGPYREFGVAAELKNSTLKSGIYWGLDQPKHSIRILTEDDKEYIMVVGDKFKTGQHGDSNEYISRLESYLKQRFEVGEFKYVWGGQQYRPADGLPYIGKQSDKLFILTGFATDGLVYGTLGSMIVSDQILGIENPWAEMYDAGRHTPLKSAKEFIKENADNTLQYLKDTPWNVDADSLKDILPGEGKLLEVKGEKLAVYKDETGNAHIVSAVCTHMKCIVNWNSSERTWDCPCHGSRFKINGEVIEGPAIKSLRSAKQKD